ncbi:aspartate racemase [Agrobacterium tumefaciens]|nr:aspartate racemase [Agrobacterium tumefaciens]
MLGILGGMGPMATVDFMSKVIRHTPATCDQDHIPTIVCSAARVPDRTAAILGLGADPLPALRRALRQLEEGGASLIAMPCNTAHFWHAALQAETSLPILHIVDAVADHLLSRASRPGSVGILATAGTMQAGIYQQRLAQRNIASVVPREDGQAMVMRAIRLIKAGDVVNARALLAAEALALSEAGCGAIVMGCTEIPIAFAGSDQHFAVPLVDATDVLAKASVEAFLTRDRALASAA